MQLIDQKMLGRIQCLFWCVRWWWFF